MLEYDWIWLDGYGFWLDERKYKFFVDKSEISDIINLNKTYKGKSPRDLRSALVTAIEGTTLVEFTFRDDSGGTRNYYVDIVSASGVEGTGYDERGVSTVNLVEP